MSKERKFLRPATGRIVRREGSGEIWPAEGALVEITPFVRRRLDDGDLIAITPPKAPKPETDK